MRILAGLLSRELKLEANDLGHCAVYEKELQRVWPLTEENRKAKIAEFAVKHGFRLAYYKQGLCAIFVEDSSSPDIKPSGRFNVCMGGDDGRYGRLVNDPQQICSRTVAH